MGRGAKAYALPNVPAKGTNARHVFATVGGVWRAYAIRPYNRVHQWNCKTLFLALYDRYLIRPYPDSRKNMIIF